MHYFPLHWPFFLALIVLFVIVVTLVELRILQFAYERIGISSRYALVVLVLSLAGSYVNIPVYHMPDEKVVKEESVWSYGVLWEVPVVQERPGTTIAVNLGGALIPTILSLYLLIKNRLYVPGLIAVLAVTFAVHLLAQPVKGVGISVPVLIPPLVAIVAAVLLSREHAPTLAYIAGSLGTLIGADLLNLGKVQGLGAPVASIGGAGTFDGIFVTGILAGLLAPMSRRPQERFIPERRIEPDELGFEERSWP